MARGNAKKIKSATLRRKFAGREIKSFGQRIGGTGIGGLIGRWNLDASEGGDECSI